MIKVNEKIAAKVLKMIEAKGIKLNWTNFTNAVAENAVGFAYKNGAIVPNTYRVKVWNIINSNTYQIVPACNNTDIFIEVNLTDKSVKEIERGYYGLSNRVVNL